MAVFNNAAQLQQYLINQNMLDYTKLITEFDIDIVRTDEMPDTLLGLALPKTRTIFLNNNQSTIGESFILSHELTHVLMGVESAAFYKSSYVSTRKTEVAANEGAFFMLIKEFINKWSIDKFNFNVEGFINYYRIPSMYYFQVQAFVTQNSDIIFA
ncbi:ImmA/IrrE family metallo-endopeptidase [Latilactobacillus sakei subsp. sakei]|uniref:ImmA/IrrE family metallo-endopeptidase n=1 Tax=Latilactobacillus sakei TaxID=1599 RepID=UPI00285EB700|nr:ImmA/IrrE family metallo-endopeptidase [Latilactobacillus sakei]MDR7924343.1 ImmA/IrrE family metallo-endopeptidase [Latilactobacillus sakei subsp. sakei]